MLLQIFPGWAVFFNRARRRDVVSGYAVAKDGEHASILNVAYNARFGRHLVKVRRTLDVSRVLVPRVSVARRNRQRTPVVVSSENIPIALPEHRRRNLAHGFL